MIVPGQRFVVALLAIAASLATSLCWGDEHTDLLQQYGIAPDRNSIAAYLKSLHPTAESERVYGNLIEQLGDSRYTVREAAMRKLMRTPIYARQMLQDAANHEDREIGYRANIVLGQAEENYSRILHAVFQTVTRAKIQGLAEPILNSMPLCVRQHVIQSAHQALASTVNVDSDLGLIQQSLHDENLAIQIAAIYLAAHAAFDDSQETFAELLKARDPQVRFAAAHALANHGDRRCLAALVELLDAEELSVRVNSVQALRALTGQRFNFVAYAEQPARSASVKKWSDWIAARGDDAELKFPPERVRVELGRTLICLATQGKVIELDASGRQIWEQGNLKYPWRAAGLHNGHRLVACYNGRCVREYDAQGKEIWKVEQLPGGPHSAERLENGHTLMACSDSNQIVEVDSGGKRVWAKTIDGRPVDARRMENGNTLVALQRAGKVVEIDPTGKEVWSLTGLMGPNTVQRLDNGNLVISEVSTRRVAEHTVDGKVVWKAELKSSAYDAQRLADGTTIVAEQGRISVYDRDGKVISTRTTNGDTRVTRY